VFFAEPVAASLARSLGSAVLTWALDRRYQIGLDSYDRLFPSQDTLPKGGFGNLIAVPLQGASRRNGNTVFLERSLEPYEDQWGSLSAVRKLGPTEAEHIAGNVIRSGTVVAVDAAWTEVEQAPWKLLDLGPGCIDGDDRAGADDVPSDVLCLGRPQLANRRQGPPLILVRLEAPFQKDRVAVASTGSLQGDGDQVAEAALGKRVLTGEEPIV